MLATLLAAPAWGQAIAPPFTVQRWTTREGLPQNTVQDIALGRDGELHLATTGGLAHFQGSRFRVDDLANQPALVSSRVQHIAGGQGQALYLYTDEGGLFAKHRQRIEPIPFDISERQMVHELLCDADEALWLATTNGLIHYSANSTEPERLLDADLIDIAIDAAGTVSALAFQAPRVWQLGADGVVRELPELPSARTRELAVTPSGRLFVATDHELWAFDGQAWSSLWTSEHTLTAIVEGQAADLFVADTERIVMFRDGELLWEQPFERLGIAAGDVVISALFDPSGVLWIGLQKQGLVRLSIAPVGRVTAEDGSALALRSVLATQSGRIFARSGQVLHELVDTPGGKRLVPSELPVVEAFAPSLRHDFWFLNADGLHFRDGDQDVAVAGWRPHNLSLGAELLEGPDGRVFIATDESLVEFDGAAFRTVSLDFAGTPSRPLGLFHDSQDRLWVSRRSGLICFAGDQPQVWRAGEDYPRSEVRSLFQTGPDEIWMGTYGQGILRYADGAFQRVTSAQGLFEDFASVLAPLDAEHVLVVGNRAFARYRLDDLRAVIDGRRASLAPLAFTDSTENAILESNALNEPRYAVDREGRRWFPMIDGLAWFDPLRIPLAPPPPTATIELITPQSAEVIAQPDAQAVTLAEGAREVTIHFDAPSFRAPRQLMFQYRMRGLESEWQLASDQESTVAYRELPPGAYTFEVQAAIADGAFGPVTRSGVIRVPRALLEQPLVRIGLIVGTFGGLGLLLFWRRRVHQRREQELEQRVEGRTAELRHEVVERRRVESELRNISGQLELKVEQRTVELERALFDLERDIERRERLERRLRESEKLEAVGRLAGGLAHDFNNILTAVLGEVELAEANLKRFDLPFVQAVTLQEHLNNARSASMRAARLTRQLLAYSRQQIMQPDVVDPLETIREAKLLLERLIADNVELKLELDPASRPVLIDPGQLEQVIVNLVVNAAESMTNGGRIRIGCAPERRDEQDFTRITVVDTGHGIGPVELRHIFEPFYSTKGTARGLGLASVQGIVLQSGGTLDVESSTEAGTTFTVALPVTDAKPRTPVQRPAASAPHPGTVLLVDDEESVLRVTRGLLKKGGLKVIDSIDPAHAIELATQHRDELTLLITDVVMPGLNGKQLSERIRGICPEISVLFISGYSSEVLSERDLLDTGAELLSKPFDAPTLLTRVADVLKR